MSRSSESASAVAGGCNDVSDLSSLKANKADLTSSDYPGSDLSSGSDTLDTNLKGGESTEDILEGFSHEDVVDDIEDGTSSVLSSSLSSSNECLAFRAPWATPPTATVEKQLRSQYLQELCHGRVIIMHSGFLHRFVVFLKRQ